MEVFHSCHTLASLAKYLLCMLFLPQLGDHNSHINISLQYGWYAHVAVSHSQTVFQNCIADNQIKKDQGVFAIYDSEFLLVDLVVFCKNK